ncbi:MAG: hypothetical protein ABL928_11440 [Sphingorhabdus sp.]
MKKLYVIAALPLLLLSAHSGAAHAAKKKSEVPAEERYLEATVDTLLTVAIGKGKSAEVRIDLSAIKAIELSYADAERLGMSGSGAGSYDYNDNTVKNQKLSASVSTELLNEKRNTHYYWPKVKPAFDKGSTIGPEALGVDFLSMRLSEAKPLEQTFALKMIIFSRQHVGWNASVGTLARIGDQTVAIYFDPSQDKSYAYPTVGRRIAASHGGFYVEDAVIPQESNAHAKDPEYRIRKMTMGTPSALGGLGISHFYILNSQGPDGKIIPDRMRTGDDDKAYGIVVDALKKERPHSSYPAVIIGGDHLSACSNISFDFAKELIYLSCTPHNENSPLQLSPSGAYFPPAAADKASK